jgi:hypothetical protein
MPPETPETPDETAIDGTSDSPPATVAVQGAPGPAPAEGADGPARTNPEIEDAVLVEAKPVAEPVHQDTLRPETEPVAAEPEAAPAAAEPVPDPRGPGDTDTAAHPVSTPPAPLPPAPARRPSLVPMVLGGAIAAALGYAFAWTDLLPRPPDPVLSARIETLAATQDDLRAALDELAARPVEDADARAEAATAQASVAALGADLTARIDALSSQTAALAAGSDALSARLTTLENRPQVTVALSEQAQAAVEAQIAGLRQEAADGIARVEQDRAALAEQADARLSALEADLRASLETIQQERAALEAARAAASAEMQASRQQAAAAALRAAMDAGAPYAEPLAALAEIAGTPPPPALAEPAAEGIPTLAALREAFADGARAALEETLRAQIDAGEIGRVEGFLRIQSGVRSLTPQEGDDPDAVLSRAEAALVAGDLDGALALVGALPDAGRTAMGGWAALAETRRAALAALAAYGNS